MLRRSNLRSVVAGAKWSPELISFKYANKKYVPCESIEQLCQPRLPCEVIPAFVIPDVISQQDHDLVVEYNKRLFDRLDYSDGHYDSLITKYKEFYRSQEEIQQQSSIPELDGHPNRDKIEEAVRRVMRTAREVAQQYSPNVPLADRVHFLQLDANGIIKAHADEERNSSSLVAGLCFTSARVMTLTKPRNDAEKERGKFAGSCGGDDDVKKKEQHDEEHDDGFIELLIQPRSLYILAGSARYEWFHSVDEPAAVTSSFAASHYPTNPQPGDAIWFRGEAHPTFKREMRSVMIWRGVSPRELFQRRMGKAIEVF